MFKMGCSMARKILAIDGKNSASSSSATATAAGGGGNSADPSSPNNPSTSNNLKKGQTGSGKTEELNDFSKLEDDPRLPLNVRQIFKITKSWKAIARTMSKTGTAMFLNLFEQNQDLFYLFDRFQHLKGKELHESMELREHAATVMSTLDQSINSLSDYDNFVTYLHSIGKLHRKVPGFKREHFWKIEQPFLKAVKQTLDERCNETIEEIYKIAIKLIIETIAEGYGDDRPEVGGGSQGPSPADENGNGSGDKSSGNGGAYYGRDSNSNGATEQKGGQPDSRTTTTTTNSGHKGVMSAGGGGGGGGGGRDGLAVEGQRKLNEELLARLLTAQPAAEETPRKRRHNSTSPCSLECQREQQPDDRLKATIICLRELLLLAVKGVPAADATTASASAAAADQSGTTRSSKQLIQSSKTETPVNGGLREFNAGNSCLGSIAFADQQQLRLRPPRPSQRHQRASSLFQYLGLDRLLIVVNRKRKGNKFADSAEPDVNSLLAPAACSRRQQQHKGNRTTSSQQLERKDTSGEERRVYLIESERLQIGRKARCRRQHLLDSAKSQAATANDHEDNEELAAAEAGIEEGKKEEEEDTKQNLLSTREPTAKCVTLARTRTQSETSTSTAGCGSSPLSLPVASGDASIKAHVNETAYGDDNNNYNDIRSPWQGNHDGPQLQTESPRSSAGDMTTVAAAASKRRSQLTTSLRRDHDCSCNSASNSNLHSTRPYNETASKQCGPKHSRDHNNNDRDNLKRPNEQGDGAGCNDGDGDGDGVRRKSLEEDDNGQRVCLSLGSPERIKQSSFPRTRRLMMLLLRGHKFYSDSGKADRDGDGAGGKVNKNEDLGPESSGSGECNQPIAIGEAGSESQFEMSGQLEANEASRLLQTNLRQQKPSEYYNKQQQNQPRPERRQTTNRLTNNADDLGELIKMLMLTLLTSYGGKAECTDHIAAADGRADGNRMGQRPTKKAFLAPNINSRQNNQGGVACVWDGARMCMLS